MTNKSVLKGRSITGSFGCGSVFGVTTVAYIGDVSRITVDGVDDFLHTTIRQSNVVRTGSSVSIAAFILSEIVTAKNSCINI